LTATGVLACILNLVFYWILDKMDMVKERRPRNYQHPKRDLLGFPATDNNGGRK